MCAHLLAVLNRFLEDYMQQIAYMIRCNKSTVYVNFEHLKKVLHIASHCPALTV